MVEPIIGMQVASVVNAFQRPSLERLLKRSRRVELRYETPASTVGVDGTLSEEQRRLLADLVTDSLLADTDSDGLTEPLTDELPLVEPKRAPAQPPARPPAPPAEPAEPTGDKYVFGAEPGEMSTAERDLERLRTQLARDAALGRVLVGAQNTVRAETETTERVSPAPALSKHAAVMQIVISLIALIAGIAFVATGDAETDKLAAGWIGLIIGYWLR